METLKHVCEVCDKDFKPSPAMGMLILRDENGGDDTSVFICPECFSQHKKSLEGIQIKN